MSQQPPPNLPPYKKPWLSYPDQIVRLIQRGLSVPDAADAERFLTHVNYYRLSGYCLAFEQQRHTFFSGVTFDDIASAYAFDVVLRDLLTEALEVIEIDVRTCLATFLRPTAWAIRPCRHRKLLSQVRSRGLDPARSR